MRLMQLIYVSRPFGFDELTLRDILQVARDRNSRADITGALICREDIYLQMLEGPRAAVTATYARILRDDRHVDIAGLWSGDAETRLFPEWSMRSDPAQSWMWTADQVRAGAVSEAPMDEARNMFVRLAAQTESNSA